MPLSSSILSQRLQIALIRDVDSVIIDSKTGDSSPGAKISMQPDPGWCTILAGKIIARIILTEEPKTASNIEGSVNILVNTELTQTTDTVNINPKTGDSIPGITKTLKPDQLWIDTVVKESEEHCKEMGYTVID